MLKQFKSITRTNHTAQPPSGGCVLKLIDEVAERVDIDPAAFGRLCVETVDNLHAHAFGCAGPAAFGRLCVETVVMLPT